VPSKPAKPAKVPKNIAAFMAGPGAAPAPPEVESVEVKKALALMGLPGAPGEPLPTGETPTGEPYAPPPPSKPTRGGKYVIRDAEGNIALTYDEPMEKERKRAFVMNSMKPFIGEASNPREKAAAQVAADAGAQFVDQLGAEKGLQMALDAYQKEMGRYGKEKVAAMGGGAPRAPVEFHLGKEERMRLGAMSDDASKIIDQVARDFKVPAIRNANLDLERGLAMFTGGRSGFTDNVAMAQLLKEMSGAAVSDKEYSRYAGGEGKLTELEQAFNRWAGHGEMPEELYRGLTQVFTRALKNNRRELSEAAERAREQVKRRLATASPEEREEQADAAAGYFTGEYKRSAPSAATGKRGKPSDEDILNALGAVK
jgi:hypothetical protein